MGRQPSASVRSAVFSQARRINKLAGDQQLIASQYSFYVQKPCSRSV
ncbi:MAG: hypothetical protein ACYCYO_21880 [Bacilli bacterium]